MHSNANLISAFYNTPRKQAESFEEIEKRNALGQTHIDTYFLDKRNDTSTTVTEEIDKYLSNRVWKDSVCIDGMSCVGKTTIISQFPQQSAKINGFMNVKTYNTSPITSMAYLLVGAALVKNSHKYIIDRSPISNYAWLIVHQLASKFPHGVPDAVPREFTWTGEIDVISKTVPDFDLALQFVKGQEIDALIILDSDVDIWRGKLATRNEGNDVVNSKSQTYWYQLPAYAYLANKLDWATIDLAYFRHKYQIDTSELMTQVTLAIRDKFKRHFELLPGSPALANIVHHKSPIDSLAYTNYMSIAQSMNSK